MHLASVEAYMYVYIICIKNVCKCSHAATPPVGALPLTDRQTESKLSLISSLKADEMWHQSQYAR